MISLVSLEWLARQVGVRRVSLGFRILEAILVEEMPLIDAAAALDAKVVTAHKVVARFKHRVAGRREELQAQIAAMPTVDETNVLLDEKKLAADERVTLETQRALRLDERRIAFHSGQLEQPIDAGGRLSSREQAKEILAAISGHAPSAPPTPTYDDQGRKVGGGSRLMTVDELADFITRADGERMEPVRFVRVPMSALPGWKIGPVCG